MLLIFEMSILGLMGVNKSHTKASNPYLLLKDSVDPDP